MLPMPRLLALPEERRVVLNVAAELVGEQAYTSTAGFARS
jgi:hypothetical protein